MKPKRRWFQFRLRTLLVLVALLSVGLSWFVVKRNAAKRQAAAVEAIREAGGEVFYEYEYDEHGMRVRGRTPGPAWIMDTLGVDFVWEAYEVVLRAPVEECLIERIVELKHLRALALNGAGVTEDHLECITRLQDLESLDLLATQVADSGLESITRLKKLRILVLGWTRVTDDGLKHVAALSNLEMVYLPATQVGDPGMAHLAALPNLRVLSLDGTKVTDAGLKQLARARRLLILSVVSTRITAEGLDQLQRELPKCEIRTSAAGKDRE